jgi:LmbE family N-acetylglucosaminyl deacetylase
MATLVCFHAHPDDESIATGGTMALAARAGHRVVLVLGTRGEQGEPVPGVLAEGEQLWERRVVETHRSAEILGVERVEFLGYEDSGMMGEPTTPTPA